MILILRPEIQMKIKFRYKESKTISADPSRHQSGGNTSAVCRDHFLSNSLGENLPYTIHGAVSYHRI